MRTRRSLRYGDCKMSIIKGLTTTVEFVLIFSVALGLAVGVATWFREMPEDTREGVEEMEDVRAISFYIDEVEVDENKGKAKVTIVNNGRFSIPSAQIHGYYEGRETDIKMTDGPDQISPGESAVYEMKMN